MRPKRWISSDRRDEFSARRRKDFHFHNERRVVARAREGRDLENRVGVILFGMVEDGLVVSAIQHAPNSREDVDGKDFTVQIQNGKEISFGVTCSFTSYKRYFLKHPGQECLWIVSNQGDGEVRQILIQFFERAAV